MRPFRNHDAFLQLKLKRRRLELLNKQDVTLWHLRILVERIGDFLCLDFRPDGVLVRAFALDLPADGEYDFFLDRLQRPLHGQAGSPYESLVIDEGHTLTLKVIHLCTAEEEERILAGRFRVAVQPDQFPGAFDNRPDVSYDIKGTDLGLLVRETASRIDAVHIVLQLLVREFLRSGFQDRVERLAHFCKTKKLAHQIGVLCFVLEHLGVSPGPILQFITIRFYGVQTGFCRRVRSVDDSRRLDLIFRQDFIPVLSISPLAGEKVEQFFSSLEGKRIHRDIEICHQRLDVHALAEKAETQLEELDG